MKNSYIFAQEITNKNIMKTLKNIGLALLLWVAFFTFVLTLTTL